MGTSITDGRYTSIHFTDGHLLSLSFDEPPETGWGVMPGYDESLPIPPHLEPPSLDADEVLPSQMHPSYPFGRPPTISRRIKPWMSGGVGNLLGTVGQGADGAGSNAGMMGSGQWGWRDKIVQAPSGPGGPAAAAAVRWGERWDELAMAEFLETRRGKEVPPGMAGAKRPPSPPSPSLHPSQVPSPRSSHNRNLQARERMRNYPGPDDVFDAPVPNETYVAPSAYDPTQPHHPPHHHHHHPQVQQAQQAGGDPNRSGGSLDGMGGGVAGIAAPRLSGGSLGMDGIEEDR